MANVVPKNNIKTVTVTKTELVWQTILFNCDCHLFDTVVEQLMKAIGCSHAKASHLAYVADQFGSVAVYKGSKEKCEHVADVLGSIGLLVKITQ